MRVFHGMGRGVSSGKYIYRTQRLIKVRKGHTIFVVTVAVRIDPLSGARTGAGRVGSR